MSSTSADVRDAGDSLGASVRSFALSKRFLIPACLSMLFTVTGIVIWLLRPAPAYSIAPAPGLDLAAERFHNDLSALSDGIVHQGVSVDLLVGGRIFYEAELDAIAGARETVNLERYIFQSGDIGDRYRDALTEAARRGVTVKVVIDAVGSQGVSKSYFQELQDAGGMVAFYHPLRWWNVDRLNNRTHRNLLIVDGNLAFTGGAGIADFWHRDTDLGPRWDDVMFRVVGGAVASLQSTFAENWVEASGELIAADKYFQYSEPAGDMPAVVIDSSPSSGGSTRARMSFQTMLASAKERIWIHTPYFVPDKGVREELIKAVRDRGVDVQIIVPGNHTDQQLVQATGRQLYTTLLQGGVKIYEFQPRMIHRKALLVDGLWSVIGTTNFDPRSFALNDEVNIALKSRRLTAELEQQFRSAREASQRWRLEDLEERGIFNRMLGWIGLVFQRQQ